MRFEEFYNLMFGKVYKYYYYKFVPKDEIEDLVHDVFFRFYKKYSEADLSSYESQKLLFGFCRNLYKEWVRKQIKEKNVSYLENYEYEDTNEAHSYDISIFDEAGPEQRLFKDIEMIKIHIDKLNVTVRKVLEYRFLEGKTRKETAELLGIKEKDVHTYQKRGIKYLKKLIIDNSELSIE